MPTTFDEPRPETIKMLNAVMEKYHGDLTEVGLSIGILMAVNKDGPAVKTNGYPAIAKVKIRSLEDRSRGMPDVTITIDAEAWKERSAPEQAAILDHELTHLELKRDRDDAGRPKLKIVLHDHQFGWFDAIVHRHHDASFEVQQAKAFADEHGQTYFGWVKPPKGGPESMPAKMPKDAIRMVRDLSPDGKSGIDSITVSTSKGQSVTLTPETRKKAEKVLRSLAASMH